jgi:aspartate racemase
VIHRVIYEELCRGEVRSESKAAYVEQIERLRRSGADSVILGCTEITMLIGPEDTELPVFDTTRIHAEAAIDFALGC